MYCLRCLEIICETSPGGMGRCPTCRSFIKKRAEEAGGGLEIADGLEKCAVCNQMRPAAGRARGPGGAPVAVCGACAQGLQQPLRYECERCGVAQRIPHPMYRYQVEGPTSFGNNTWACHSGRCLDVGYTRWRIHPSDAARVPADDCPESWGRREEWLAAVRQRRRLEALTNGDGDGDGALRNRGGGDGGGGGGGGGAGEVPFAGNMRAGWDVRAAAFDLVQGLRDTWDAFRRMIRSTQETWAVIAMLVFLYYYDGRRLPKKSSC